MKKALGTNQFLTMQFDYYTLSAPFAAAFGSPEKYGVWFVWGNSGNGKTRFALQLAKELASYGKVLYNSLEEGITGAMKKAFVEGGLKQVANKISLVSEGLDLLEARLDKRKSPDVVIIDSLQYTQMTFKKYTKLKDKYAGKKLLIFISHAEGKMPRGNTAVSVMYDANLKVWVEGYKAFSKGRYYGQTGNYTIWQEGAKRYYE